MESNEIDKMHRLEENHWWFQGKKYILKDIMRGLDIPEGNYLDIGCGTGFFLRELGAGRALYGVDVSEKALSYCRGKVKAVLVRSEGDALPFDSDFFSFITLLDVVEHVEDDRGLLKETFRVCVPGGVVIITVPAFEFLRGSHDELHHHKRRYDRIQLRALAVSAGFGIERLTYTNFSIFVPVLLRRMISRNSSTKDSDLRPTPHIANQLLKGIYRLEARYLRRADFPFGVSLLMALRKPAGKFEK